MPGTCVNIPLQELPSSSNTTPLRNSTTHHSWSLDSSSSDDGDDDYEHFSRNKSNNNVTKTDQQGIPESLPYYALTLPDVVFSLVVFGFVLLQLALDITLVVWHIQSGHSWGAAAATVFIIAGGVALLNQHWAISRDHQKIIFDHPTCVRAFVNSIPWLLTVITSYQSASTCVRAYRTPASMYHNRHRNLEELNRSLLKIQTLYQGAPLSVVHLVLMIEDVGTALSFSKALLSSASVVVNLTLMSVANLPLKSDTNRIAERAAYSPYSRLFVGLRMISNFASRTLALSLFISAFKCVQSIRFSHLIPLCVIVVPRVLFAVASYVRARVLQRRSQTSSSSSSNGPEPSVLGSVVVYYASAFFPFGDVLWLWLYVCVETVAFMVVGLLVGEILLGCVGMGWLGVCVYLGLFTIMFAVVPCGLPFVTRHFLK